MIGCRLNKKDKYFIMNRSKVVKKYIINIVAILIGTFLMGISFSVFLSPNKISPTGFSGIASLVSNVIKQQTGFVLSPSIIYLFMNAVLFVIAFKTMGLEFIILSITGVLGFSLSMWICTYITINVGSELLLCSIYGGLFMGVGAGIVIRAGGSTGGGDTIACMLKNANAKISTGQIIMLIDAILIIASCFIYGINYGMYAIITCILMGYVCDTVINGVKGTRAYYIVTSKPEQVYQEIGKTVHRGMTEIKATGMYTHQDKTILMCLLSRSEIAGLKRAVRKADQQAFMFSVDVKEAIGMGFEPMQKDSKEKPALEQEAQQPEVDQSVKKQEEKVVKTTKKTTVKKDK